MVLLKYVSICGYHIHRSQKQHMFLVSFTWTHIQHKNVKHAQVTTGVTAYL